METGIRTLTASDLQQLDTSKQTTLGAVGATADGRRFRYAGFAGTATVNSGILVCAAAQVANAAGLAITATGTGGQVAGNLTFGARTLVVTNSSTAVTVDEFADGFIDVLWSGGPFSVRIEGNTAAAATTGYITLLLAPGGLQNAAALVPGTDTVTIRRSPYALGTATLTQSFPLGVTVVQVPNTASVTNYGWIQTGGHAEVNATSGTKGYPVTQDLAGTAGYVANTGSGAAETVPQIGVFLESAASSLAPVELNLP